MSVKTVELLKRLQTLNSYLRVAQVEITVGVGGMQLRRTDTQEPIGVLGTKKELLTYVDAMISAICMFEPGVMASDELTEEDLDHALALVLSEEAAAAETRPADIFSKRPPAPLAVVTEEPVDTERPFDHSFKDELDLLLDSLSEMELEHGISD
jgi:hypothetical protein